MQFFSAQGAPAAPDEPVRQTPPWIQPPAGEIPTPIAAGRILARRPGAALSLRRIDSYSIGCSFAIRVDALRTDDLDDDQWDDIAEAVQSHRLRQLDHGRRMRFGITLADGRSADTDRGWRFELGADEDPNGPILSLNSRGGGGSQREYSMSHSLWLWPLPPSGQLMLHFQWLDLGIQEGSVELDATPIRAAASSAVPVWE